MGGTLIGHTSLGKGHAKKKTIKKQTCNSCQHYKKVHFRNIPQSPFTCVGYMLHFVNFTWVLFFSQTVLTHRRINHMWATGRQTKKRISRSFSVSRSANLSPEWLMECKIHSSSLMFLSLRYNLCWYSGKGGEKRSMRVRAMVRDQPWNSQHLTHTSEHLFMGDPWAIKQLLEL